MANKEQLARLKNSTEKWNKWRGENSEKNINLGGADLNKADLSGANLSGVNFSEANLRGADLSKANLSKANLSSTDLSGANLRGADFSKAILSGAILSGAILSGAILSGATLRKQDLSNKDLSGANLSEIVLNGANLSGTNLSGADLTRANLSGTNLSEVNLSGAILSGAHLSGANFHGAILRKINLSGADLTEQDLSNKDLSGANLNGAKLSRANLSGANLTEVDLSGANLYEVDLSGAIFTRATLHKQNLSNKDFNGARLEEARLIEANLSDAHFIGAHLNGADLRGADLSRTNFHKANLSGANLNETSLIKTDFTQANLENCSIYGIAAWDIQLDGAIQTNLIITPPNQSSIIIDSIEVAQFIYLLLHNEKIHDVIDTITSKVVLILGRFTAERKQILDILRSELRSRNYSPLVFDFEEKKNEGITEAISTLVSMAHFVLIDPTDLDNIVSKIATSRVPIQPFLIGNHKYRYDYALFRDLQQRYSYVLSPRQYKNAVELLASFQNDIIQIAEAKITELKQRKPLKIFFWYHDKDKRMLDKLKQQLSVFERSGQIEMWDDRNIEPGNVRDEKIEQQLFDARIILLLMSPDSISSNDFHTIQARAMELYEEGRANVIPIILRACAWKSTALGRLQGLPRDGRPIGKTNQDDIFLKVSGEIGSIIKEMV